MNARLPRVHFAEVGPRRICAANRSANFSKVASRSLLIYELAESGAHCLGYKRRCNRANISKWTESKRPNGRLWGFAQPSEIS
jgi:hypothetical protein